MISSTKMSGICLYSDINGMSIFITALNKSKETENDIYNIASKAYEIWMCGEEASKDWTIGDWLIDVLAFVGYKKEKDYYMFFDSNWD